MGVDRVYKVNIFNNLGGHFLFFKFWEFHANLGMKIFLTMLFFSCIFFFFGVLGGVWYMFSNNNFQFLNKITCISTHFSFTRISTYVFK